MRVIVSRPMRDYTLHTESMYDGRVTLGVFLTSELKAKVTPEELDALADMFKKRDGKLKIAIIEED